MGGQCWLVLGLMFRIWAELKSMGIIALETDSMTSKTPYNMYHTKCFMKKKHKNIQNV